MISGSLFSRSLINRRPSPAASPLGVRSCGYIAYFDGVLNQCKVDVFFITKVVGISVLSLLYPSFF